MVWPTAEVEPTLSSVRVKFIGMAPSGAAVTATLTFTNSVVLTHCSSEGLVYGFVALTRSSPRAG
jgi:hypothetical protein